MIPDVEGDSRDSMEDYFRSAKTEIRNTIDATDEEVILARDIDELTQYFIQDYILPTLTIDDSREKIVKKEESTRSGYVEYVTVKVGIPLVPKEGIDKVVARQSNPHFVGLRFRLENCYLVTKIQLNSQSTDADQRVAHEIDLLEKTINNKNGNAEAGNHSLEKEIKPYIEQKKQSLASQNKMLEGLTEKLKIKLEKKGNPPVVDLSIKKKIKMVMPEPKKNPEPVLEQETLKTVIELIQNQCRQFEITPKAFARMPEELLRDQILGMLNSVFAGDATGESFVKGGKTDVRLKTNVGGGILSAECKFWAGEKLYKDTIDQHFDYLTWAQNYAIQITFSCNQNFSDVLESAKKAAKEHKTFVNGSFREIGKQHFVTEHVFPADPKKKVEVHHLVFDLNVKEK